MEVYTPKVSILMGIYNCSGMLEGCVNSLLSQTYTNWELIMCDDGSSDDTYRIANQFAKRFPDKIKLIKNEENYGLAYTLNKCIDIADGEFLARQDADDFSTPDRLEKQVKFLQENNGFGWVSTGTEVFDNEKVRGIRRGIEQPTKYHLIKGAQFCHATTMFRYEVLKRVSGYKVSWYTRRGQDYDLWMRLYAEGFKGYNLPDVLYMVREDNNTYKRRKYRDRLKEVFMRFKGYRAMKLPFWSYIFTLRPVLVGLVPRKLMKLIQESKIKVSRVEK